MTSRRASPPATPRAPAALAATEEMPTNTVHEPMSHEASGKLLYRVAEAMKVLSLSRSVIYEQLRCGRLRSVRQGNTRLVPAAAITEYVALLERESQAPDYGVAS